MYNPILDTFIKVVDCGSFTKAAEYMYISPTAVMKQINSLEDHLNLKLIARSPSGIRLTEAGAIIYRDSKFIIDYSKKSISGAKAVLYGNDTTFCVGTSLLNPAKPFMDLWYRVNKDFPKYKLHLVPFDDDHNDILSEIEKLGVKFDFLIGVCDSKQWLSRCNFLPLGRYKKMIAVPREHRLANKKFINIEDLYGETLMMVQRGDSGTNDFIRNDLEKNHTKIHMMVQRGDSGTNDFIRNDLEKNHTKIHIEDTQRFYDLSVFNKCAETGKALLTIECWQEVHPGLVSIPVNWDYSIPYGLLYSFDAPQDVLKFVKAAEAVV